MSAQRHLLLIDDEAEFLVLTRLLLEMEGFRVSAAGSGEQAVALLAQGVQPDLVLLDYHMPGLTGGQTLARLRKAGLRAPALLLSAVHDVARTARAEGFDAAVAKPFTIEKLLQAIHRLLQRPQPA